MATLSEIDKQIQDREKRIKTLQGYLDKGQIPQKSQVGVTIAPIKLPAFSEARQQVIDEIAGLQEQLPALYQQAGTMVAPLAEREADRTAPRLVSSDKKLLDRYRPYIQQQGAATTTVRPVSARAAEAQQTVVQQPSGNETPSGTTIQPTTGVTTNATTGSTTRPTGGKVKKTAVVSDVDLASAVQQFFPNYSTEWLSENGVQHFGQDLIDLFRRVAAPDSVFDLSTEAGRERVRTEIRKTVYWQTTTTAAKNFDQLAQVDQQNTLDRTKQKIANTYGDLGLDDATLTEIARNVARNGLTGLGEQQAVYNSVFRMRQQRPDQTERALEGAGADRIRQLARAYNYRVSDQQIQSILTGTPEATTGIVLTEDGLRERMQKAVKGAMPQLADQIDAGLTLEDIGSNYRRYAANLLEKSEDEINMFDGPYLEAFGNRETGQLSLGEWTQKVKSDPRFGWQYTNQANQAAGDIALTIARAFGKVR